jgi:hypothetical protein
MRTFIEFTECFINESKETVKSKVVLSKIKKTLDNYEKGQIDLKYLSSSFLKEVISDAYPSGLQMFQDFLSEIKINMSIDSKIKHIGDKEEIDYYVDKFSYTIRSISPNSESKKISGMSIKEHCVILEQKFIDIFKYIEILAYNFSVESFTRFINNYLKSIEKKLPDISKI